MQAYLYTRSTETEWFRLNWRFQTKNKACRKNFFLKKAVGVAALAAMLVFQPGCIVFLSATAATISYMRNAKFHTAFVVVVGDADQAFDVILGEVEKDKSIEMLKVDRGELQFEFVKNKKYGALKISPVNNRQV